MKKILNIISCSAVAMTAAALLPSCSMEEPFGAGGEGSLTLLTEINGDVIKTRADIPEDEMENLRKNCIIYIENSKGVIRKFKGVDEIPPSIKLQTGHYVAEGWSGDSVSASFDRKFYRGWQDFDIKEGNNSLTLKCNIANVVVSVDPSSLEIDLNDPVITFSHSRDQLVFDKENIPTAKGYFMMPNADKDLNYKIEGTKLDGTSYSREGVIAGVQRAHEYVLTLSQNENPATEGGALFTVEIADIPLVEQTVDILPPPVVRGIGFNLNEQVANLENSFEDVQLYVRGYEQLSSVLLSFSDNFEGLGTNLNILNSSVRSQLAAKGIVCELKSSTDASGDTEVNIDDVFIKVSADFLNGLKKSPEEYSIKIEGIDSRHREGSGLLRIANDPKAVEILYPVSSAPIDLRDMFAVGARRAVVPGILNDPESVTKYGILYRLQGTSAWNEAYPEVGTQAVAGTKYTVKLTGLEPGKTYEYCSFSEGAERYESSAVLSFTTEGVFSIPNASMEEWSTYGSDYVLPGSTYDKLTSYWGSGNEGAAMAKAVLTDKSTDMVHSGTYSARLASASALGMKLAAGNIFIGEFDRITNVMYGIINVGREYNGSHPDKVRVYLNYRPGSVDFTDKSAPLAKGDTDHGQVYIGLVTEPLSLNTNDASTLFNIDNIKSRYANKVVAYGEVTLKENYGADKELKMLEVPFEYFDLAKTVRPKYLVIVACASKYGDYYAGSSKSVMYVDDFELIYE